MIEAGQKAFDAKANKCSDCHGFEAGAKVGKKITWDKNNCFVILNENEKEIKLSEADTSNDQGSLYLVHFTDDVTEQILNTGTFEFKLKDEEGRNWRVTFSLYERTKTLKLSNAAPREDQL